MSSKPVIVLAIALLGQSLAQAQSNTIGFSLVGTCDLRDEGDPRIYAWDVSVAGEYAYVACSFGGLLVVDVHNPEQPIVVGRLPTEGRAISVRARDRYVYLTVDRWVGLQIIDVSNPSSPTLAATWKTVGSATGICLVGDHAYVATWESALDPASRQALEIIDVSDPEHPTQAGCFYTANGGGVDVAGRYAYLTGNALQVIDVSNPARPFLAGKWDEQCRLVRVIGSCAYVAGNVWDPVTERDVGFLRVLDVTDPTRPVEVGTCTIENGVNSLEVAGHYACIQTGSSQFTEEGLTIVDVSKPTTPARAATFKRSDAGLGMQVLGNTAYLADAGFLHVARITLPLRLEATVLPGNELRLHWLGGAGVRLQQTMSLVNPNWQDLPESDGQSSLELPITEAMAFFRLVQR